MRLEMGLLQMEVQGRPDGETFGDYETYYGYLSDLAVAGGDEFELDAEQCAEIDRELVQYYHRRVCWLALREFRLAQRDADHTLSIMDLAARYCPEERWVAAHEQYRPFVLFHRVQAATLATLEEEDAETALTELESGLDRFRELFRTTGTEEAFEDDEMVRRLLELQESIREQYELGPDLQRQLDDAIAAEEYELAARLRDEIARRDAL